VERKLTTCPEVESSVEGSCGEVEVVDASSWDGEGNLSMATSNGCAGRRGEDEGKGCLSERGRGSTG
jgi:hypothetical protein